MKITVQLKKNYKITRLEIDKKLREDKKEATTKNITLALKELAKEKYLEDISCIKINYFF